ncbi:MAG: 4-hydroxythreonine-4-phosphate dehydrogenase PdxA [Salinivirgaceae bacterium]|nr:4-hydroxythreonine-4-phosphate dehydrogenase PdxA [Salinivirgaceae bacterium]MDD4747187.1 4-hydroxythreonine-4-phosphate dehydrogenase PdxA [Salinivirgaceae bacterium]MDY0280649.1 4-hydroxythreonine-4-phosphate dehydrogenase PdxA [Salinivirgaceae bacterium]
MSNKPIIGISQGDINGIGYEIIIKGLMDSRIYEMCTPVLYGSPKVAAYHRKALNISNFTFVSIKDIDSIQHKKPNLINVLDDNVRVELGKITSEAGEASVKSLDSVVEDLKLGKIDALITAPISKKNVQQIGFDFPGHTEFLKTRFESSDVLMLMVADSLRLGVVTGHIPLNQVSNTLTIELVYSKIELMHNTLVKDFAITRPHIAIMGLNPHAGEQGVLGKEEDEIIIPAINRAREKGILALGPFPADGFFGAGSYRKFDGVLAMYHDQGLIPFKTIAFDQGVNYTAGLSIIRTSPAHGTALDIAGKNLASEQSFLNALYLALDIVKNRKMHAELTKKPLQKQNFVADQTDDLYIDQIETNVDKA